MRYARRLILLLAAAGLLHGCQRAPAEPPAEPLPITRAETGETGGFCGGIKGFSCKDPANFCRHSAGQCRIADGGGRCAPRPQVCTRDYRPVCGCDGKTYANACEADSAGAAVDHPGACGPRREGPTI